MVHSGCESSNTILGVSQECLETLKDWEQVLQAEEFNSASFDIKDDGAEPSVSQPSPRAPEFRP